MATAFFISERYLKDNSPMGDNVDVKEIYPFARTAEDTYIHEALGTPLYTRLCDSLNASPPDTTADEKTLIKLIRSALVWYTCYDAMPFIWLKIRNIGMVKQSGENMESVSMAEMSYARKELKNKGDFYLQRMQDYLYQNQRLYSEYIGQYSWSDLYPNKNVSPSCDMAFDNDNINHKRDYYNKWIKP